MKKTLIIALIFMGLTTVSCGSSWKCTNRYCKSPEKEQSKQDATDPKTKTVNA